MLSDAMVVTTVAVTDLDRAKQFFAEQLALPVLDETPFAIRFEAGKGTQISVRRGQPNVGQTVAHFEVDDIEAIVRDLTSRGVTFEEYETPKTTNFIAQIGPSRGAWFKDPTATCLACARDRFQPGGSVLARSEIAVLGGLIGLGRAKFRLPVLAGPPASTDRCHSSEG